MASAMNEVARRDSLDFDPRAVRSAVWRIRRDERRQTCWAERRVRRRIPLMCRVYLTPVCMDGETPCQPGPGPSCMVAYTTDVSVEGIGLTHDEPLPTRHAIVTFDREEEEPVSLLIEIEWSYCGADRSYRSGAKFMAVSKTPSFLVCRRDSVTCS